MILNIAPHTTEFPEGPHLPGQLCAWCKQNPAMWVAKDNEGFTRVCHECHVEAFPGSRYGVISNVHAAVEPGQTYDPDGPR